MKKLLVILFFSVSQILFVAAQQQNSPDFTWGNSAYFNINIGESIQFNDHEIKLLKIEKHFNQLKIGTDTVWLKVSRRSLPEQFGNLRIFVADNSNVKALSSDEQIHGLLKKDALICLSLGHLPLLDPTKFLFPISFNDGFKWSVEEDSYMFSVMNNTERKMPDCETNTGVDFDLQDARGIEKHWIVSIENSTVVWIEDKNIGKTGKEAAVLLESESQPGIYYLYKHLYNRNLEVKKGQKLLRGELIGTIWGDENWGHLTFSVIKSDSIPTLKGCEQNVINCFPQMFELYFKQTIAFSKNFSKGRIFFGKISSQNGNQKNTNAFENYSGKGWILGKWNTADKVDYVQKGTDGNVQLRKKMFAGSAAECTNPNDFYDFEINVQNGIYRIRSKMGDISLPTWLKISFEGVEAGIISNEKAGFNWTSEKVVKVNDGKLTVRIFVDPTNEKPAGISEIVFQRAY
jgi:hypothetical protein